MKEDLNRSEENADWIYDPQKQFSNATLEQRNSLLRTDPAVIWPVNHSINIK